MARRLIMAGKLIDEDPELALAHAVAARRLASRIGVVREAVGLAAYRSNQWQTAVSELRTYHRMTGRQTHLAVLADCERALGRPEKAIDIYRSAQTRTADSAETIELLIVAAGARRDMGASDAAVAMLQIRELTADAPWTARLRYAYADALLDVGRRDEAREWFARAVDADPGGETDAAERLLDLDGVTLEEDEEDEDLQLGLALAHGEIDEQASAEREPSLQATFVEGMGAENGAADLPSDEEGGEEVDDIDDEDLDDEEYEDLDDEDDIEEDEDDEDEEFDDEDDDDEDEGDEEDDDEDEDEDEDDEEDEDGEEDQYDEYRPEPPGAGSGE